MLNLSDEFRRTYPGTGVGVLSVRGAANPKSCPPLEPVKKAVEEGLKARYGDKAAIKAEPVIVVYRNYYKRFKSTYHVLNQVHSVAHKGRSIPKVAALVEAMFTAELKNMVLTSGHDLNSLEPPFIMDVAGEGETFTMLAGREASVKAGDILFRDAAGPAGSIVHGPDKRTMIRPETKDVLLLAWGVPGLTPKIIENHLKDMADYIRIIAPGCRVEKSGVVLG